MIDTNTHTFFPPRMTLKNLETLIQYCFHGNITIYIKFKRVYPPLDQDRIGNIA